ncbi:hypothetical protein GGR52DRAFT_582461 [Hypoxylon sp. FL1284]|nr:hypothetical protein GGR52DRAFT_582461 [Hypoxylon sp. FL1284]
MDVASSPGTSSKVGKLKLAAKRWKKQPSKESFTSNASSEEYPRGRSPNSRELSNNGSGSVTLSAATTQSNELAEGDDDERHLDPEESPEAYHSDHEDSLSNLSARPTVPSTHPSQIGQLTTSSPIIQADYLPEVQSAGRDNIDTPSRSATFAAPSFSYSNEPTLLSSATGLQPPRDSSARRSKSPAGRIRDAFRGKRNVSATQDIGNDSQVDIDDYELAQTPSQQSAGSASRPGSSTASQPNTNELQVASPERRRRKSPAPINTGRPHTPPTREPEAPVIVNTPPTPTDSHVHRSRKSSSASVSSNPAVVVSPPNSMISHRRLRSGSGTSIGPSKLSNITLAPLTPTPENGPLTPGGGFFSSMLSAAQNAANSLSSAVANTNGAPGGNKPKSNGTKESPPNDDDKVEVEPSAEQTEDSNMGDKELAVKTLGQGDLSLSQLGIQEPKSGSASPAVARLSDSAIESRSRSESAPVDSVTASVNDDGNSDDLTPGRPRSVYEQAATWPPTSVYEGKSGIQRSSSIRSALGRRRKRGSTGGTAGTGTTIGAAIAAANASVAHPSAAGSAPKLTGFAIASKKRNRDFHVLFKSVPDDDYLIEDYSCALQREILAHGRLYVSEGHLCFSSNILGWATTLVMSFDEIVSVEKRNTALVFKNGLMITTLHAKYVFASFASRDSTYDLIVNIWKLGHPSLQSTLNGVSLEGTGGDKTEKLEDATATTGSQSATGSELEESEDGDDVYDEDLDHEDVPDVTQPSEVSPAETDGEKSGARKVSGALASNGATEKTDFAPAPSGAADFPGPATHAPTECGDADAHYDIVVGDDVVPAPLGKVYNLMFGPASVSWMGKWLTNEQKCTDLQIEDKKGLTLDNKTRNYTYIKPLYASIGPRQTKCIVNETMESMDLEKAVSILVTTQNPDVPSGNVFCVKTKYCLTWAENNATHVTINCTIEWTGKSWLKGPIEKGAKDGQTTYCKDIFASLKAAVSSIPRQATINGGAAKGKKKRAKGKLHQVSKESLDGQVDLVSSKSHDWGVLEPVHGILGPIVDIIRPVLTGNVVYGLLVGLLVATWFGFGFNGQPRGTPYGRDLGFLGYPERAVAYEEIWRREESDLWDWLEERVGLHRLNGEAMPVRKRVLEPRTVEEKLREERMNEREVEEALRVTEEKLEVLKSMMDRKKAPLKSSTQGRPTTKVSATER